MLDELFSKALLQRAKTITITLTLDGVKDENAPVEYASSDEDMFTFDTADFGWSPESEVARARREATAR